MQEPGQTSINLDLDLSVEEYFNKEVETIVIALQREGLEYNQDGELVNVVSPYAMGIEQEGNIDNVTK